MMNEKRSAEDHAWSMKVASIAVETLIVATPPLLKVEQAAGCKEIIAEEIYARLVIGDRPPA